MTPLQWILSLMALALITIVAISYIHERIQKKRLLHRQHTNTPPPLLTNDLVEHDFPLDIFTIPKASTEAAPKYAVMDIQTTGLSTTEGAEDNIVELAWLILDDEYNEISRGIKRVWQVTAGTPAAKRIHHITEAALSNTGENEYEVLLELWNEVANVPIWVFHNAKFDLSILRAAIRNHHPQLAPALMKKIALCTMSYLTTGQGDEIQYPSLLNLTASLYQLPLPALTQLPIISLRNTYLTRACLIKLLTLYPHHLANNYPRTVAQYLN